MRNPYDHFARIAHRYRHLRSTDLAPILFIRHRLRSFRRIRAVDVGCGAGRYDLRLFQNLRGRLQLVCVDYNERMLRHLYRYLRSQKVRRFAAVRAPAEKLPFQDECLDCIFTFNAVHHFHLAPFLAEVERLLRPGGYLFIYTRFRSQNRRNIWGRFFPQFSEKETRLYELPELESQIGQRPTLMLEEARHFLYRRVSDLATLLEKAENHHYSTFYLYGEDEFWEALVGFQRNLRRYFPDPSRITWIDENALLVVRKVLA